MSTDGVNRPDRMLRLLLAVIAFGLLFLFGIAIWLEPDPRGFGTHQQLGFPPCQFRQFLGVHCPHCGMTTSFSNIVRGRFDAAWDANPLGILLATMFAGAIPWCLATAVTGRFIGTREPFWWLVLGSIGYLVLAVMVWLLRVFVM
ncbi:MAG: DUF2752 domain-containing protein [Fuerstiella sp.]